MSLPMKQEVLNQSVQATPSMSLLFSWVMGVSLNQYYLAAAIGFIGLQAAYLIWKWRKEIKNDKKD
jgi:hypothetical protein